jgi:hypothetical protein
VSRASHARIQRDIELGATRAFIARRAYSIPSWSRSFHDGRAVMISGASRRPARMTKPGSDSRG